MRTFCLVMAVLLGLVLLQTAFGCFFLGWCRRGYDLGIIVIAFAEFIGFTWGWFALRRGRRNYRSFNDTSLYGEDHEH